MTSQFHSNVHIILFYNFFVTIILWENICTCLSTILALSQLGEFAASRNKNLVVHEKLKNLFFRTFLNTSKKESFARKNIGNFKKWIFSKWIFSVVRHVLQNSFSYKFRNVYRKTPVLESLFKKVSSRKAFDFIKKRLQHRCFL